MPAASSYLLNLYALRAETPAGPVVIPDSSIPLASLENLDGIGWIALEKLTALQLEHLPDGLYLARNTSTRCMDLVRREHGVFRPVGMYHIDQVILISPAVEQWRLPR